MTISQGVDTRILFPAPSPLHPPPKECYSTPALQCFPSLCLILSMSSLLHKTNRLVVMQQNLLLLLQAKQENIQHIFRFSQIAVLSTMDKVNDQLDTFFFQKSSQLFH